MLQLQAVVSLNRSGFESGLSSLSAMVSNASNAMMAAFGGVAGEILAMGRAFGPVGVAVGAMKEATTVGASFEQQMANVASVSGLMGDELDQVAESARNMAKTTRFTATEAGDALYSLASAGVAGADALSNALAPSLLLAGATMSSTTLATETMTAAMANFKIPTEEATRIADQFAGAIASSPATMDRLAEAMKYAGPAAAAFGISLERTVAEVAAFHQVGLRGEMAGTSFRMALIQLSEETQKAGSQVGAALQGWNASTEGLTGAVSRLNAAGVDTAVVIQELGARAGPGMAALMKLGADAMVELAARIERTADVSKMYELQLNTLSGKFAIFKSAIEEALITLYGALAPALTAVTVKATELADAFTNLVKAAMAGDWGTVKEMLVSAFSAGMNAVQAFADMVQASMPRTFSAVSGIIDSLSGAFNFLSSAALNMFREMSNTNWSKVLSDAVELVDSAIAGVVGTMDLAVRGINAAVTGWQNLASELKIVLGVFTGSAGITLAIGALSSGLATATKAAIAFAVAMQAQVTAQLETFYIKLLLVNTNMAAFPGITAAAIGGAAAFGVSLGLLIRQIPGVADALDNLAVKTGQWLGLVTKQDMTLQEQIEHFRKLRMEKIAAREETEKAVPALSEENAKLMESTLAARGMGAAVKTITEAMLELPPAAKEVKNEVQTNTGFWDSYQASVQKSNNEMMESIITMRTFTPAADILGQAMESTGNAMETASAATESAKYSIGDLWNMLAKFKELKISAFDVSAFVNALKQLEQSLKGVELPDLKLPDFGNFKIPDITNRQVNTFLNALRTLKTGLMNINFGELGNIDIDIKGGGTSAVGKLDDILNLLRSARGVVWA